VQAHVTRRDGAWRLYGIPLCFYIGARPVLADEAKNGSQPQTVFMQDKSGRRLSHPPFLSLYLWSGFLYTWRHPTQSTIEKE
jgi:hypothetical protein